MMDSFIQRDLMHFSMCKQAKVVYSHLKTTLVFIIKGYEGYKDKLTLDSFERNNKRWNFVSYPADNNKEKQRLNEDFQGENNQTKVSQSPEKKMQNEEDVSNQVQMQ